MTVFSYVCVRVCLFVCVVEMKASWQNRVCVTRAANSSFNPTCRARFIMHTHTVKERRGVREKEREREEDWHNTHTHTRGKHYEHCAEFIEFLLDFSLRSWSSSSRSISSAKLAAVSLGVA